MKIIFSYVLAFVLSLFCFPQLSFAPHTAPSTITAAGWPTTISWDDKIKWEEETLNKHIYYYTTLGEWPQTFVGTSMEETLNSAVSSGSAKTTGKVYNINGNIWTEYSYDGKKYVQGNQKIYNTSYTFKDGTSVGKSGRARWFIVEPIKWWVIDGKNPFDEQEVIVISDLVLTSNICFNRSVYDGNSWENSFIRTFSNGEFYEKSNLKSVGNIVKHETIKSNVTGETADTGSSTTDYVWLLSYREMNVFSPNKNDDKEGKYYLSTHRAPYNTDSRKASPSDFALSNNTFMLSDATDYRKGYSFYWTRSAGNTAEQAIRICINTYDKSINVNALATGFRPSMTLIRTKSSQASFDDGISSYPGIYKASDGYHITDFTGLKAMSDYTATGEKFTSTDKFYINNDIDCAGKTFTPIKSFTGIFDGQNNFVFDLVINSLTACFIESANNATIQNISFLSNNITGSSSASFINQTSGTVTLSKVLRDGNTTCSGSGICSGLVGTASSGTLSITHCSVNSKCAKGSSDAFGLIGSASGTVTITDSYFSGTLTGSSQKIVGSGTFTARGVYCASSSKYYYTGFTDSDWVCGANKDGLPALKWNQWTANLATTKTVVDYLKGKSFASR